MHSYLMFTLDNTHNYIYKCNQESTLGPFLTNKSRHGGIEGWVKYESTVAPQYGIGTMPWSSSMLLCTRN